MNPGRELDALIAEKVMGLAVIKISSDQGKALLNLAGGPSASAKVQIVLDMVNGYITPGKTEIPNYSTNIADAWTVVEKIKSLRADSFTLMFYNGKWSAGFGDYIAHEGWNWDLEVTSDSAPHCICLAALRALGV